MTRYTMTPFHRALQHTLTALFVCATIGGATDQPTTGGANLAQKMFHNPPSEA